MPPSEGSRRWVYMWVCIVFAFLFFGAAVWFTSLDTASAAAGDFSLGLTSMNASNARAGALFLIACVFVLFLGRPKR